jgi:hypothetical protein
MLNDEVLIYNPDGSSQTCSELIDRAGGWERLGAAEASLLSSLGCQPGPLEAFLPFATIEQEQPFWTGSVPDVQPTKEQPVLITDPDAFDNPISWLGPILASPMTGLMSQVGVGIDIPRTLEESLPGQIIGAASRALQSAAGIEAGITATAPGGLACWNPRNGKLSRRAQVRLRRMPDGSLQVEKYCRAKRMNPLNPRALSRAARRLGSFQRIASAIEKTISRACKTKSRRPRMSYSGCSPKRKGC